MVNQVGTDDRETGQRSAARNWGPGLSSRLFVLTISFILIAEAFIFLPSAANFRSAWLNERVDMAQTAVLALEAAPERRVSDELSRRLLENARIVAVATGSEFGREIILSPAMRIEGEVGVIDMREATYLDRILSSIGCLFDNETDFIRILQTPDFEGDFIEVVVEAAPLKRDLVGYSLRVLLLSLFISTFVGILIYLTLVFFVVRPIRRITKSIEGFRDAPRDFETRILPTNRQDEIGRAENTLSDMATTVKSALRERERLAQLGEAMAKINHDLRNSLATAQIVSDGLSMSEDPRVTRAAPRLERALERAIGLAESTLQYGRSEVPEAHASEHSIADLIEEAAMEALTVNPSVMWLNEVDADVTASVDPDHLHRVIVNLVRNAAQAMAEDETSSAPGRIVVRHTENGDTVELEIADEGPGIPNAVRDRLFKPFSSANRSNGTGLGLAIARELSAGMGARLDLKHTGPEGTVFVLILRRA